MVMGKEQVDKFNSLLTLENLKGLLGIDDRDYS
jgi:hypothetical protein